MILILKNFLEAQREYKTINDKIVENPLETGIIRKSAYR